ncbi:DUF748 domain-containing protein [Marinobacter sp. V034]|uniref:DUF748 domain-containing protein n=1 Tax=Marinobacter sp. V034 TaxID=3459610 RepID=UPI004044BDAA
MANPHTRKPLYTMLTFWLALVFTLLFVLYVIVGFVGVPWWLERNLPPMLKENMGWETTIDNIDFNPFLLTLDVTGFKAKDDTGTDVVTLEKLHTDVAYFKLFTGTVGFENITLVRPFTRIDLLQDYGINLAKDWNSRHSDDTPEDAPNDTADDSPLRVYFDEIALQEGHIRFRDFSTDKNQTFDIQPLNLDLNDLATFNDGSEDSDYQLSAAIDKQQIKWEGSMALRPFRSNGSVELTDITYSTLWHFAEQYAPYVVDNGSLSLKTDYAMHGGEQFDLQTRNGELSIKNISARLADSDTPFAKLASLAVSDIGFSLTERALSIDSIALSGLDGSVSRSEDGTINLMQPYAQSEQEPEEPAAGAGEPESDSPEFRWNINSITLADSKLNWQDNSLATPANLSVSDLNIEIGQLKGNQEDPVPYELNLKTGEQGTLSVKGQTTLSPFTLEASLALDKIALAPFEPYVQDSADLKLNNGLLTVNGKLDLDDQTPTLTGTFNGSGQINDLALSRPGSNEPLLAWRSVVAQPIEYNLDPARLEIGRITVTDPKGHIVLFKDGTTNIDQITGGAESADTATPQANTTEAAADEPTTDEQQPEFIFRIQDINIANGDFDFVDRSIEPVFSTRLSALEGNIEGLSNISPQQGKINLKGKLGERGSLAVTGSIGTLGEEDTTKLKLNADNLAMSDLSPYFGRYVGYSVDSGKLKLDLDYDITGSHIKADNRVIMDQLALGESVQSEEAVNAPVRLGLSLLRDGDGVIDIDLPIEGDLDDPEFRVGRVVMRTFVNLLARVATSPFNVLGSVAELAGFSGEELGQMAFVPGEARLAPGEEKKFELLAKALSDRSQLLLNVRGSVAPELDELGLKSQKLFNKVGLRDNASIRERITALESQYSQQQGQAALDNLKQSAGKTGNERLDDGTWLETLAKDMTADVSLPPEALDQLAKQRGAMLHDRLAKEFNIPDDQLFMLAPSRDAKTVTTADKIQVIVPFTMDAR